MILALTQYSLNQDHKHLKRQQLRSCTSYPDCQVAMDMQRTQYLLIPKQKWMMVLTCWKDPKSECPDIWIRLPRHKWPKSWSSMEDPVVPLERNGRRFPIGNAHLYTMRKCYSYLCMWMTSNGLERNIILIRCGMYSIKKSIWESQHFFWSRILVMHSKTMRNKQSYC